MTHLSAAALAINVPVRDTGTSTNPEPKMARLAPADSGIVLGSLLALLRGTALGRALANRVAERQLTRAVARLAETSPHLLADIGIIDTPAIAPDMSIRARFEAAGNGQRIVAAPVPVALRPAQRPAVIAPRQGRATVAATAPVSDTGRDKTATL